jgi:hypothetical protein
LIPLCMRRVCGSGTTRLWPSGGRVKTTTGAMTWAGCHHPMPTSAAWQVRFSACMEPACAEAEQLADKDRCHVSALRWLRGTDMCIVALQVPIGPDAIHATGHGCMAACMQASSEYQAPWHRLPLHRIGEQTAAVCVFYYLGMCLRQGVRLRT